MFIQSDIPVLLVLRIAVSGHSRDLQELVKGSMKGTANILSRSVAQLVVQDGARGTS